MSILLKFRWIFLFVVILCMAILRPIHQDDGWYASYALRIISDFKIFENVSFFSFSDANGGSDKPAGFLFSLLQVPFYLIFGVSILAVKIFNSLLLAILLYVIHLVIKKIAYSFRWVVIVIFMVHPVFYYHFYNRPETLGLLLSVLSFYLMVISKGKRHLLFFSYFIWAFILDVHPIAIFTILGIGAQYWFLHRNQTLIILGGGLSGLIIYALFNYLFNGHFGLLSLGLERNSANFGDHYLPILQSNLSDYLRIALERFQTLKGTLLFSLIWIFIPLFFIRNCKFTDNSKLIFLNTLVFWLLVIFLTEASSNGFGLYSIFIFIMFFIVLVNSVLESYSNYISWKWLVILPLVLFTLTNTLKMAQSYYVYFHRFNKEYFALNACIKNGSKVLMRPIFAFNMGLKSLSVDYTFGILNVMLDNKISFEDAIRFKKYDYVVLDERNLYEELLIDQRSETLFLNPAYSRYKGIGITSDEFNKLLSKGFLKKECEFEEMSHGKTVIYKVFN